MGLVGTVGLGCALALVTAGRASSQSGSQDAITGLRTTIDAAADTNAGAAPPPPAPGEADGSRSTMDPWGPQDGALPPDAAATGNPPRAGVAPGATTSPASAGAGSGVPYPNPPRHKAAPEADLFAAPGLRLGSFVLRPAIEVWSGYDSNPARVPAGRSSSLLVVSPELQMTSDWERHAVTANIRGSYMDYPSVGLADRPSLDARVGGRIDVTRDSRIDLEGRDLVGTDYPGSPNIGPDIARLPIFDTVGGTLGVGQRFNRIDVSLKGTIDRTVWQPSQLIDGTSSSNRDRDLNQYGAQLRTSYELTPGLKPFLELDVDSRVHDLALDRSGLARDSHGTAPRGGSTFELSPLLTGEISVGYLTRLYRDPNLPDLKGLIADGSLVYAVTPLTSMKLVAKSVADESVVPGVSGLFRRDAEVDVDHAFRRWLVGTAKLGYGVDDYTGSGRTDRRYLASAGLTYKLTRTTQIKGELREEWLRSSVPGQDYTATVAMIGLRYQR